MEMNFFSRNIGMWPQYGYSWEPNLETAAGEPMVIGEDVGIAPIPVPEEGDTPYTTYGGRAAVIMQTSPERQNRAWDVLQFMMQPEQNMFFIQELGYLPTLTELKEDPYFQEPQRQPFVQILEQGILPEQTSAAEAVASAIQGVYQQAVVEGGMTAEEAATAAADAAREALEANQ
jgi:multiple sugar transport system substrate-binding protein